MGWAHLGLWPVSPGARIVTASGSNSTVNLANRAVGTVGVGIGVVAATATGPITTAVLEAGNRSLSIVVDNRLGTADAYLARPEDIPTAGTETAPYGAMIFPAGQISEISDISASTWNYVLRLLDGASLSVTVLQRGGGL